MGGHAAWRKRVAAGDLAKGSGGAALRHRPRLGRKGADLALNRLGNLGGHGNPKKKPNKRSHALEDDTQYQTIPLVSSRRRMLHKLAMLLMSVLLLSVVVMLFYTLRDV